MLPGHLTEVRPTGRQCLYLRHAGLAACRVFKELIGGDSCSSGSFSTTGKLRALVTFQLANDDRTRSRLIADFLSVSLQLQKLNELEYE